MIIFHYLFFFILSCRTTFITEAIFTFLMHPKFVHSVKIRNILNDTLIFFYGHMETPGGAPMLVTIHVVPKHPLSASEAIKRVKHLYIDPFQMTPGVHFAREGEGEDTRLTRSWARQGHADRLGRDGAVSCGDWVTIRCNQAEQENSLGLHIVFGM